ISGLDETVTPPGSPAESAIDKPDTVLTGERAAVDFPVIWTRASSEVGYRARYLTAKGIGFEGKTPLFEGTVVRLRVGTAGAPLELSGRVVLCRPEERGYFIQARLF